MKIKRFLWLSLYHLVFTFMLTCFSFYLSSIAFEGAEVPYLLKELVGISNITLLSPFYWIFTYFDLHKNTEWVLFVINSLLWGFALELLISNLLTRKQKNYWRRK